MSAIEPSIRPEIGQDAALDPIHAARVNLAACYRLVAHFDMDDSIYTHISARVPGTDDHFLINPYGLMFNEITASSLVTVDINGTVLDDPDGYGINPAGFTIHSAIHSARHDVDCVLHTHTVAGVAVSCQEDGLLPLNQWAMQFYERVAYHDYESIALDLSERERLVADIADRPVLILRNHGLLTAGRTVAEAFSLISNLEKSCQAQLALQASGATIRQPSAAVCAKTAEQYWSVYDERSTNEQQNREWNAFRRLADSIDPSYRD